MKKGIAVPYIIALILGIAVVALVGYWFFVIGGGLPGQAGETQCRAKLSMYCTQWSQNGYTTRPTTVDCPADCEFSSSPCPADETLYYAPECCAHAWASGIGEAACREALGQPPA